MEDVSPQSEETPSKGRLQVRAVITRKDGTIVDLGIISEGAVEDWRAESNPS